MIDHTTLVNVIYWSKRTLIFSSAFDLLHLMYTYFVLPKFCHLIDP